MQALEPTLLLISHDKALCSAVRAAMQLRDPACRIGAVADFAAARQTVADLSPDVIVLQESSVGSLSDVPGSRLAPLADIVATLAGFAPVVVLGNEEPPAGLAALIAAGAADFVQAGEAHFPDAAALIEKRLHSARRLSRQISQVAGDAAGTEPAPEENFGELLRHELNNPLTGILGNAELLLAEMHRQTGAQFSEPGVKRLETIAALAVRMRETVRRLSQACDSREGPSHSL